MVAMTGHNHQPVSTLQETRPYSGSLGDEPRAAGNICVIDHCECGAVRRENRNGRWIETGEWSAPPAPGPGLLRAWRREHSLTQVQAAERLGLPQSRVSEYETGAVTPELETAVLIERVAGIPPSAWVA